MLDLKGLATELFKVSGYITQYEKVKSDLRKEFFDLVTNTVGLEEKDLPTKSVELPQNFLERIELTEEDFFKSRYPGWNVVANENDVYILIKDPAYIGYEFVDPESKIKISKQIQESTPEIDWNTLEKDDKSLFTALAKPVTTYELNEENYTKLVKDQPEIVATLQRHLIMKTPVQRLPKPVKVDDDE